MALYLFEISYNINGTNTNILKKAKNTMKAYKQTTNMQMTVKERNHLRWYDVQ
jgi:hypothetical protein